MAVGRGPVEEVRVVKHFLWKEGEGGRWMAGLGKRRGGERMYDHDIRSLFVLEGAKDMAGLG